MRKRNYYRKPKRKLHIPRVIGACLILILTIGGVSYSVEQFNNPKLVGRWYSLETGEIVQFRNDGTVLMKDTGNIGDYNILSPNQLQYTINDITFDMYYEIEGRKLMWGLEEDNLESFTRK